MKSFRDLCKHIRLDLALDVEDVLREAWESSGETFARPLRFLSEIYIDETCRYLGIPEEIRDLLYAAAERISLNEDYTRLMWHFHYLIVQNHQFFAVKSKLLPELEGLGEESRLFYILLTLSGVGYFGRAEDTKNISRAELQPGFNELVKDISAASFPPALVGWYQDIFAGEMFKLRENLYLRVSINPLDVDKAVNVARSFGGSERDLADIRKYIEAEFDELGGNRILYLLENREEILGVAQLVLNTADFDQELANGKDIAHIHALQIAKNKHRQGLGTLLMQVLEKEARKLGKTKLTLGVDEDNPKALELYKKLNYGLLKEAPGRNPGVKLFYLQKDLAGS